MPLLQTPLPPLAVLGPPDAFPPEPPVETRIQRLPFEALSWENFERLCHRLTARDANVEYCARYGRQGDAQEGIDIFARCSNGRYHCLQAKRHRTYGAGKLRDAVDLFLAGGWAARSSQFTIAVQAALRSPEVQEEIELQVTRLAAQSIKFVVLDGESLTDLLRHHPVLIDDFFGRQWITALLGKDIADSFRARLDGAALAQVRSQLARVYEAHFQFVDPGSFGSIGETEERTALTLLERYSQPDMLVRETGRSPERIEVAPADTARDVDNATISPTLVPKIAQAVAPVENSRMRRLPLSEWLSDGERMVVLGDAGCGKSTLLRVIALDLLQSHLHFPELASRWGQHVPVYIPFARWSSHAAREGTQIGLKEIVRRSLEQLLTASIVELLDRAIDDRRVLLLVDGLDEWSNEQAARSTLSTLVTTAEAHGVPVIVAGRPRGLSQIGTLPSNWKRGIVAPLSTTQQAAIAGRWFQRYAAAKTEISKQSDSRLRTGRFMAELARDASLGIIAAVPLLLIGLVTLALRGQILPRTRADIYDQLVRVLLEVHPVNRATASGDTESRFRHATDPDQRRGAIARLAFAMREEAGGAGISIIKAREILKSYLASPEGFDLPEGSAAAAAGEILSVNAETQGIIVEKSPGEVGFVHASFEEFLGAEYVSGWPFLEIEAFVRQRSGDGRWRNVISNLLGGIKRRDEFDRLVVIIEEPAPDEILRFHKEALLGEIAFSGAGRSPATAKRLALETMRRVEAEDWLPARREALASVLRGLADPGLKADVERRLGTWLPAQSGYYRSVLINALGNWTATAALQDTLWQAMHDEDRGVQRVAAAAYAKAFASSPEAYQRLVHSLSQTRDHAAAAAILESLALGWPNDAVAKDSFNRAYNSGDEELRLVGILGLLESGTAPEGSKQLVLRSQNFWSNVSYPHRDLAVAILLKYWADDDNLVEDALQCMAGSRSSLWEHHSALAYLLRSSTDRADVKQWILNEFAGKHPFTTIGEQNTWAQLGRFAKANPEIRIAANAYWCDPDNHLIGLYKLPSYVAQVADQDLLKALVKILAQKASGFDAYWALTAILTGWSKDNPIVAGAVDGIIKSEDADIENLVSRLPDIMPDKAVARERLLRMSKRQTVRRDLLAVGFEACGCDYRDDEVLDAIIDNAKQLNDLYNPSDVLFRSFSQNPKVRALARKMMTIHESLPAVAAAYPNDPEFESALLTSATPLPVDLRAQIVEVAAAGAAGTSLEAILGRYHLESDSELCVRMAIAHYRAVPLDAREAAKAELLSKATAVGSNFEVMRAAALAGLTAIESLDALVTLEDRGQPVGLSVGGLTNGIVAVQRLICERFSDFEDIFGDTLLDRLKRFRDNDVLAEILALAPGASPRARAKFLSLAEHGAIPKTPAALRALATERPRSDLLREHCLRALDKVDLRNDVASNGAEIGLILRDHFSSDTKVLDFLTERFRRSPYTSTAAALAVYAPDAEILPSHWDPSHLGRHYGDWIVAVYVSGRRADAVTFCDLVEAMVSRPRQSIFDAQQVINLAIEERLQSDIELERLFAEKIRVDAHPSVAGSFSRYLAAGGKLSPDARGKSLQLLTALGRSQRLPICGYDAVSERWRALRVTLLDAITSGLELA